MYLFALLAAWRTLKRSRPGAWVVEVTGLLDTSSWPRGMRVPPERVRDLTAGASPAGAELGTSQPEP
jgi:hypothetical protein